MVKLSAMGEKVVNIGVHIWVPGRVGFPAGKLEIENNRCYVEARTRRLAQGPENQVLLVADNFFSDTRTWLGPGAIWDGHLIKTYLDSSRPKEMDFGDLRSWILREFPADKYEFWGTEVYLKKGKPVNGCPVRALKYLRLPKSGIDLKSCLVAEAPKGNPWRRAVESMLSSGWSMP